MSIINDALKKAKEEKKHAKPFMRWIWAIIIIGGLIASSYFTSVYKKKDRHVETITNIQNKSIEFKDAVVTQDAIQKSKSYDNNTSEVTDIPNVHVNKIDSDPFSLTGIIRGEGKLLAVINNAIVEEGQTIGEMKVKNIYNDHVVLSDNANEYIITLK